MIEHCGARGVAVKRPSGLNGIDGLIIPGGESTTIGKLIEQYGFAGAISNMGVEGVPIFGTCAGLIVLARRVDGIHGPLLGLAEVTVVRNAFGRQVESFEKDIWISGLDDTERPFRAVFIRAPVITETGEGVTEMARVDRGIVMARDRNYLLGTFHPELTEDDRVHRYFLDMVARRAA